MWIWNSFHCLFCHGYEDRGATSSGVLAVAPVGAAIAVHLAQNAAQLTDQATIYTNSNDDLTAELKPLVSTLVESKFKIDTRKIKRLLPNDRFKSVLVEFVDGSSKEEKFLVHNPETSPQGPFADQLGLATTASGDIQTDGPFWQTNVAGVFAVGDCSTPYKAIPSAISSGCNAAVMASAEIQAVKFSQS